MFINPTLTNLSTEWEPRVDEKSNDKERQLAAFILRLLKFLIYFK